MLEAILVTAAALFIVWCAATEWIETEWGYADSS